MSWNDYDVPAAGVCCLVVFTVSIILFACSFDVLEPRYYGLMYDDTFKTVGRSDILRENRDDNGRLLIGLGRSILYYPVSLVVMEFLPGGADGGSMNVWTSNGQSVFLDVSLQIKLVKEKLPQLYYAWGKQWRDWLRVIIEKRVKEVAVRFHTLDFFEKRVAIANALRDETATMFASEGDGFFQMVDFQLRKVGLPAAFDNAVIEKLLRKQQRQKARNSQQVSIRHAQKSLVEALAEADAALVLEMARQDGNIKVAKERTDGEAALIRRYATLYRDFGDTMGWLNGTSSAAAGDAASGTPTSNFGFDALHFYIYSRLGKDHRARATQELIGF